MSQIPLNEYMKVHLLHKDEWSAQEVANITGYNLSDVEYLLSLELWIDPPSGWQYGFPKRWDYKPGSLANFAHRNGYDRTIDLEGCSFSVQYKEKTDA